MRVHTIGHSTRALPDLLTLLHESGIDLLVDVRAYPRSRSNPQFNSDTLAAALDGAGIGYRHMKGLGGRRARQDLGFPSPNGAWRVTGFRNYADYALTPAFGEAFAALTSLARDHHCAVMCAEALWHRCHRRIIADYLLARGIEVVHILDRGRVERARLTPGAEPQADGKVHYPAAQGSLI